MHRISLIAAASIIAFSSVDAAQRTASKQQDEHEPIAADAGPAASDGESANRHSIKAVLSSGSTRASAVAGAVVSQSGTRARLVPVTPFVSHAISGHAENDEELRKLIQEVQEREQRMLQNPEYRDLLRARQRVALSHNHPHLPELLQISKEQADQLLNLLAEQQVREQAASKPMPAHGDAAAVQEFMENTQERHRTNEAELAALLGATKFQEWKDYEQSAMARFHVQRLQQMLPADARLRADQLRPLVSAIWREQRQISEERTLALPSGAVPDEDWLKRMRDGQLQRMAATNQRILDATASILSPKQLEYFGSLLQQELDGLSGQFFFRRVAPLPPSSSQPAERAP